MNILPFFSSLHVIQTALLLLCGAQDKLEKSSFLYIVHSDHACQDPQCHVQMLKMR